MLAFTNSTEKQSPTVIGAGCKVNGDIHTDHTVQIHGDIIGNIVAQTVIIGRGGHVTGQIETNELFLHGSLDGPAIVDVANIFSNAQMRGVLEYNTLNISANTGLECKLQKRKGKKK